MLFCALTGELLNARLAEVRGGKGPRWRWRAARWRARVLHALRCGAGSQPTFFVAHPVAPLLTLPQVKQHLKGKKFARAQGAHGICMCMAAPVAGAAAALPTA